MVSKTGCQNPFFTISVSVLAIVLRSVQAAEQGTVCSLGLQRVCVPPGGVRC